MSLDARGRKYPYFKIAGRRISMSVITLGDAPEPRLRFDRVAIGLIKRLQASLSKSVPDGKTVLVTVTAPIRQSAKTGAALEEKVQELLRAGRARLETTLFGNRIQVRVLDGGASRTSKLIVFIHNPEPDPASLFEVTQSLLECIRAGSSSGERWLIIAGQNPRAPVATLRQVCLALQARTVFKRILWAEGGGVRVV